MDLVQDHVLQGRQGGGLLVEHVAQDLGGHDHDVRLGVDGGITGQQPHSVLAVAVDQVMVFLVAQRFDGGGVEGLDVLFLGQEYCEVGHDGLAGTGGSGHQDVVTILQGGDGLQLEVVQREGQLGLKACGRTGHAFAVTTETGVTFRRPRFGCR